MRRSPIRRGNSKLKRSPMKRGTARSAKDFTPAVRDEIRRRSRGRCEAAAIPNCQRHAVHVHHRLMRSQGGLGTAENGLDLCSACHQYIHDHPELSYQQGWLVKYWREVG